MLAASFENAEGAEDVAEVLFVRNDTGAAAEVFLKWFRRRNGRCSRAEMSGFADLLASGRLGCKLARQNFYRTILHKFVKYGLVALVPEYDAPRRRRRESDLAFSAKYEGDHHI